nr:S9 family peptidase [Hyphomonas sp. Mor2]
MRRIGFVVFLFLLGGGVASAEHPKPPLEAYGALPQISDAELSPNGTKVAAIAHGENDSRLIVFDLLEQNVSSVFGLGKIKARGVGFYDDDHVILRASDTVRTRGFRGEYEFSAAFSVNLKTDEIKQLLVRTKGLYPAQSGMGRIVGRAHGDGEVLMPALFGDYYSDPSLDLFRADLGSDKGKLFRRGTSDTRDWFVGDRGNVLARVGYNNEHNLLSVERPNGDEWDVVFADFREIPFTFEGVMPDESGLVYSVYRDAATASDALMKLGFDGEISGPVTPAKDREIEAVLTDSNRKIVGAQYAGLTPDYTFLDEDIESSYNAISTVLPNATIYVDSWSDDRSVVLYNIFDLSLGEVWLIHRQETDDYMVVFKQRPNIPNTALGAMLGLEYQARDGMTIQAILTVPPSHDVQNDGPLPTLVLPHGGPATYDRFDFDWMAQYFANRGYAVLQPNFRGSKGFGKAFEDAGDGEWGGKMQDDISDGVAALAKAKMVDPERVCIAGASYGGYAALAGATFTPDLFKCVIAIAPVSDLNKMLREERRNYGRDHWVIAYWEEVMADGDARRKKLRAISPVRFADNVRAPVLLLHGDDDTVVPYNQSIVMRNALRRADKKVELIKLKGEDHWLSVADTRLQTLREMDRFIAEHLPLD